MSSNARPPTPVYTIIQADGLYSDDAIEQSVFAPRDDQNYLVDYRQTYLWSPGTATVRPWSDIDPELRRRVNGITALELGFTKEDLELFPNLKVFVRMGVGYDRLDRQALAARNVTVCNTPDYGVDEVADHAFALALSLRRGILLHHDRQRTQLPAPWMQLETPLVRRLQCQTFGIMGLGRIGTAVALRAKACGFQRVLFYDPYVVNGMEKSLGVERTRDVTELFRRSNVLSLHCPCTRETRGSIDYSLLSLLPPGAVLVNTARGEILSLDAVERCLREGILAGAGLDVLPEEPIPEDRVHPLIRAYRARESWLEGRMVLTCHSAFYSPESFQDIRKKSCQTMRDVLIDGLQNNVIIPSAE